MKNKDISKYLSLVLRHSPQSIELVLDENGWADVEDLLANMNSGGKKITSDILDDIVATNDKKRFSYNEDKTKIRANQGHSISVDFNLIAAEPPQILFHGTVAPFLANIKEQGLLPMSRQHVHLSIDRATAIIVGNRRDTAIVLEINALKMHHHGFSFYLSDNKVWLCDTVPPQYIQFNEMI